MAWEGGVRTPLVFPEETLSFAMAKFGSDEWMTFVADACAKELAKRTNDEREAIRRSFWRIDE
jgi:hypothetical protein